MIIVVEIKIHVANVRIEKERLERYACTQLVVKVKYNGLFPFSD